MTGRHRGEADDDAGSFVIVSGDPSPEELAALTAVLQAAAEEALDEAPQHVAPRVDAWAVSARGLRVAVNPAAGAWRSFSG